MRVNDNYKNINTGMKVENKSKSKSNKLKIIIGFVMAIAFSLFSIFVVSIFLCCRC